MGKLKRYKLMAAAVAVLTAATFAGTRAGRKAVEPRRARDLPRVTVPVRLVNGVNLNRPSDQRAFILRTVRTGLKPADRGLAFDIARTVITESNRHQIDPLLVLAVIKTESHFDPRARGRHGEVGLMQVMPATARWLTRRADADLADPVENIRVGTMYLAHLRARFPRHTSRYVSAYNMGARNVRRLLASRTEPLIYAGRVLGHYRDLNAGLRRHAADEVRQIAARALE